MRNMSRSVKYLFAWGVFLAVHETLLHHLCKRWVRERKGQRHSKKAGKDESLTKKRCTKKGQGEKMPKKAEKDENLIKQALVITRPPYCCVSVKRELYLLVSSFHIYISVIWYSYPGTFAFPCWLDSLFWRFFQFFSSVGTTPLLCLWGQPYLTIFDPQLKYGLLGKTLVSRH